MHNLFDNISESLSQRDELRLLKSIEAKAPEQLEKDDALVEYQKRAFAAVAYARSRQAIRLAEFLQKRLAEYPQDVQRRYDEALAWLKYAGIAGQTLEGLVRFFTETRLRLIFEDTEFGDITGALRQRLAEELIENRDSWRARIADSLRQNSSILTKTFVDAQEQGTVANWLRKYDSHMGRDAYDSLARAEFENQSQITARLDALGKLVLNRCLNFYEFLKSSSYDAEAFEEDAVVQLGGRSYLITKGKQILVSGQPRSPILTGSAAYKTQAPHAPLPAHNDIASRARAMLSSSAGSASSVFNHLRQSIESADARGALACLLLLSQIRQLDNALMEHEEFRAMVAEDLRKSGSNDKAHELRMSPAAPQFLARFLKIVLEDKIKLSHEDAIAFGKKLSQILEMEGDKYKLIIKDGRWNK